MYSGIIYYSGFLNLVIYTWDDYAIMSMVESGLGISILPQLILKRVPYHIVKKEMDVPAYRSIGLALRDIRQHPWR
jgi:DNA-binding transcriptional LysR family regulator